MRQVGENIFKKRTSCDATLVWWNDHPSEGVALVAAHISMQKMSENSDLRELTICNLRTNSSHLWEMMDMCFLNALYVYDAIIFVRHLKRPLQKELS